MSLKGLVLAGIGLVLFFLGWRDVIDMQLYTLIEPEGGKSWSLC